MTAPTTHAPASPDRTDQPARRWSDRWLRPLAWATLSANVVLVLTGGAVRLTGSGLGCPTWPRCTDVGFTPHGAYSVHSIIEFSNRTLTFGLVVIAVATVLAAWRSERRDLRWLSVFLALGIPVQAVLGGISVLTDLNPWVVSLHLLVSMAIIGLAVLLLWRHAHPSSLAVPPAGPVAWAARATFVSGWAVLYLGTVVTGAGPHAGDINSPRNGLSPRDISQLHADLVFLFVGLTIGLLFALHATGAASGAIRAVRVLLVVELAQGVIGFVQYFTGVPIVLVAFHLLGAALISATMAWALLAARRTTPA